jgi:hypothetical protein
MVRELMKRQLNRAVALERPQVADLRHVCKGRNGRPTVESACLEAGVRY